MSATGSARISSDCTELELVDALADEVKKLLTDRGGERHVPPWEPRQNVVVGVLPATVAPPPPVAGSNDEQDDHPPGEADATSASVDDLLSGADLSLPSIGMTFVVESRSPITVTARLEFAIYVQEYATLQETQAYVAHTASTEGDASEPHDAANSDTASDRTRKRRPVTVLGAWRRVPVSLAGIDLRIGLDEDHTVLDQPLAEAVNEAIDEHFGKAIAARPFSSRTRTISTEDLASPSAYESALRSKEDPNFVPVYPRVRLTGFAQPLGEGRSLVNVSVTNASVLSEYPFQDLCLYDCRLSIMVAPPAQVQRQRFELAPRDYRYSDVAEVWGQGNACVVMRRDSGELVAETLPVFQQPEVTPRTDHVTAPKWSDLASDPEPALNSIESAMRGYLQEWDAFIRSSAPDVAAESSLDRTRFDRELERFGLGRRAMREDHRLERAFRLANEAFSRANANKADYDSWRLFQIVYLVSHLPDLAAREHVDDPAFRAELDYADVLWVPTGGGKTEAYLGLIVTALLYDRLRGKTKGVTAWLKFPLRMLSVQQLSRVLRILTEAEKIRREELDGKGDPFELGYLVGGSNTPNSLTWPREWWPGFEAAAEADSGSYDERRLMSECPFCHKETVGIDIDKKARRVLHRCRSCREVLPLHMSDEEIFRSMPSVLVGTVDKLTGLSWFGEFTQFSHGARRRCPDHGYFTFTAGGKCLAGNGCGRKGSEHTREEGWYDPVPALIIQDEMHLLKEELGAFDAHFEGALAEIQSGAGIRLPSKILAASATIEQYEDQLRQVYGRKPRSFPTPGFERTRSFYSQETANTRRVYLGVMPHYRRKADVAGMIQRHLVSHVASIQDELGDSTDRPRPAAQEMLFNYELSLAYVNSKIHGDQILDDLRELAQRFDDRNQDHLTMRVLTGDVKVADLAEPISRIEKDTLDTPRAERIRALVGTSVVSHGVDLERLNTLVMAGLPPTVADYIQASSRSGRAHVGLVVTVFDAFAKRERSAFVNFSSFHQFLDRMVAPVPVNKYAYFGADRTLPGIVMALLWDLALDPSLGGPPEGIKQTRRLQPWWNGYAHQLKPRLRERLERCYRAWVSGVNDRTLEDELAARVLRRWEDYELPSIVRFNHDRTDQLFTTRVLSSFRDVDETVGFSALPMSADAFEQLTSAPREQGAS